MAHLHLPQAMSSQRSKVQGIVGHTKHYIHPTAKADEMANSQSGPYFENRKLDPPAVPAKDQVGP